MANIKATLIEEARARKEIVDLVPYRLSQYICYVGRVEVPVRFDEWYDTILTAAEAARVKANWYTQQT